MKGEIDANKNCNLLVNLPIITYQSKGKQKTIKEVEKIILKLIF